MKHLKNICICLFAIWIALALLTACTAPDVPGGTDATGNFTQENTEQTGTVPPATKAVMVERSSIAAVAEFQDWLEDTIIRLELPITYTLGGRKPLPDGSLNEFYDIYLRIFLEGENTPSFKISMDFTPHEVPPEEGKLRSIALETDDNTGEAAFALYQKLSAEAVSYLYGDAHVSAVKTLLTVSPGTELYTEAKQWQHSYIGVNEYSDGRFGAFYDLAHSDISLYGPKNDPNSRERSLYLTVPYRSEDPSDLATAQEVERLLAQTGIPAKITFWDTERRFTMEYTGDGEDIYSDYLGGSAYCDPEEETLRSFYLQAHNDPSPETFDAMLQIFQGFASEINSNMDEDFMTAFFSLVDHRQDENTIYNRYGASVVPKSATDFVRLRYEADGFGLSFDYNPDDLTGSTCSFYLNESQETSRGAKTINVYDFLNQYRVTGESRLPYYDGTLLEFFISDVKNGEYPYQLRIETRPQDYAIQSIYLSCYLKPTDKAPSDKPTFDRFSRLVSHTISILDIGYTETDVYEQIKLFEDPNYPLPFVAVNSDDDAVKCEIMKVPDMYVLNIEIVPEEVESETGNPYVDMEFGGDSEWMPVQYGKFTFKNISEYMRLYFESKEVSHALQYTPSELVEGEQIRYFYISHPIGYEETGAYQKYYNLITHMDENPHFEMNYNTRPSQLMGLPEGYFLEMNEAQSISLYPIAFSLLCDSGMTEAESERLFVQTDAPNATLDDGRTVTFHAPRNVAHILVRDPKTGDNQYFAMTTQDFENTYQNLDGFVSWMNSKN